LILKKISETGATRCQILRLKCTKIDFGWGSAPDPTGGAYSAPPDPLAVFKGPTSKGKKGRGREEGKGRGRGGKGEGRGREGEGGEGENDLTCHPLSQIPGYATEGGLGHMAIHGNATDHLTTHIGLCIKAYTF